MTSFGEIDIRSHLLKIKQDISEKGKEVERKTRESIKGYMEFIDSYRDKINFIIYGPIASQKDNAPVNNFFPRYGSEIERNRLTLEYNELLRAEAEKRELMFFSLAPILIDKNYRTRGEYIIDQCRLANSFYNRFVNLFIEKFNSFYSPRSI